MLDQTNAQTKKKCQRTGKLYSGVVSKFVWNEEKKKKTCETNDFRQYWAGLLNQSHAFKTSISFVIFWRRWFRRHCTQQGCQIKEDIRRQNSRQTSPFENNQRYCFTSAKRPNSIFCNKENHMGHKKLCKFSYLYEKFSSVSKAFSKQMIYIKY